MKVGPGQAPYPPPYQILKDPCLRAMRNQGRLDDTFLSGAKRGQMDAVGAAAAVEPGEQPAAGVALAVPIGTAHAQAQPGPSVF